MGYLDRLYGQHGVIIEGAPPPPPTPEKKPQIRRSRWVNGRLVEQFARRKPKKRDRKYRNAKNGS